MKASEYRDKIAAALGRRPDARIDEHQLRHGCGEFTFLRLASADIGPADRVVFVRAGIHGDEMAGPLTLLERAGEVFDLIHGAGLKAVIYPLGNPSGFERGIRYNCDNDPGSVGNNDFLRYELEDGSLVDDLGAGKPFRSWMWASDPRSGARLAAETKLQHDLLRNDPLGQAVVCLDLHQDHISAGMPPAAYHYAFGDLTRYRGIVEGIGRVVPVLRNAPIGAGFHVKVDAAGKVVSDDSGTAAAVRTDEMGFIDRHDGSLPDLFWHLGAPHCVTVETTGATPLPKAIEVNMIWLQGLVELAAEKK